MGSGSTHKHKSKKEKKKKLKKKKSSKISPTKDKDVKVGESGDEINLEEKLHPIGYYINDREEMINQMFSVIKPHKLRAMLPPILKTCSLPELRAYCLEEISGMSAKRISSALEGRDLDSSSDSDESNHEVHKNWSESSSSFEDCSSRKKIRPEARDDEKPKVIIDEDDTLQIGISQEERGELLSCIPSNQQSERKRPPKEEVRKTNNNKKKKTKYENTNECDCNNKGSSIHKDIPVDKCDTEKKKGKDYRDIIELEMRARAIRALLRQQQVGEEDCQSTSHTNIETPKQKRTDRVKSPRSESIKQSKSSDTNAENLTTSNAIIKPARRKLKRNTVIPPATCLQSVSGDAVNTDVSSSVAKTGSRNTKELKETEQQNNTVIISQIVSKQTVPNTEFKNMTEENEILVLKLPDNTEKTRVRNREDGGITDGEEVPDNNVQVELESSSSYVITLDESEDEKLSSSSCQKPDEIANISLAIPESEKQNEYRENIKTPATRDTKTVFEGFSQGDLIGHQCKSDETVDVSWASRWLQSKGVQKVVSTSKMCAKIRNRMKSVQKEKKANSKMPEHSTAKKDSVVIVGSVNEYNMLDKPRDHQIENYQESEWKK